MPRVTKQTTKPKKKPRENSILSRAVPVASVRSTYLRTVIYGENRVGKTTFACTFPKPLLLVSYEPADAGGVESVTDVDGVEVLQLGTKDELLNLAAELKNGSPYKTHVLDTGTSFQDAVLRELLGLEKLPEQLGFGTVGKTNYIRRAEITKESLRPFMGLPAHTVVLNKEKDHRPRDKDNYDFTPPFVAGLKLDSFIASDMGGAITGWLHDCCPYVCRLYLTPETEEQGIKVAGKVRTVSKETGRQERRLLLQLQPNFAAGFRAPTRVKVPDYVRIANDGRGFQILWDIIQGKGR